jgi:hypothetical protein
MKRSGLKLYAVPTTAARVVRRGWAFEVSLFRATIRINLVLGG